MNYTGETVFVVATGPSLSDAPLEKLREKRVIAVNDAYKLLPFADVLYACDTKWWTTHHGAPSFPGAKWSTHERGCNDKTEIAKRYNLQLLPGHSGDVIRKDGTISYGGNSGFQAVGLAVHFNATRIILVGFDMRTASDGRRHYFGAHPKPLRNSGSFPSWIRAFETAAKSLPAGVEILNATPNSALKCFKKCDIDILK
jgi:hypothetical protein